MVIIGLDYGEQRIGMAVSDELEIAAHPLPTVARDGSEMDAIGKAVAERGATRIAVGLPIQMDGVEGIQARKVRAFVKDLQRRFPEVEVVTVDERLTTAQAQRALSAMGATARKRRENIDRMAAQIILQRHLDQRASERRREAPE